MVEHLPRLVGAIKYNKTKKCKWMAASFSCPSDIQVLAAWNKVTEFEYKHHLLATFIIRKAPAHLQYRQSSQAALTHKNETGKHSNKNFLALIAVTLCPICHLALLFAVVDCRPHRPRCRQAPAPWADPNPALGRPFERRWKLLLQVKI